MTLAFGEAISALGLLFVLLFCSSILASIIFRLLSRQKIGLIELGGLVALLSILILVCVRLIQGDREYNPADSSLDRVAGTYSDGELEITLRRDGTYSSTGINGLGSGGWSNTDWNLSFENSSLEQPRWITRNGVPAILPYYSGVDGSDGPLLLKQ